AYHALYAIQPWAEDDLSAAAAAEMEAGEHDLAQADLERIAASRPLTGQEQAWLGAIYAARGNSGSAVSLWEQARAAGTLDANGMRALADLYVKGRDWDQAL